MTSRRPELVSRATRRALRGLATEMYVKAIEGLWQDQGFVPVSDLHYEDSSVRRTTFESYAAGVDWTDVAQVERALRVFESQLRWLARQDWHRPSSLDEIRELLDDDGFELDERCQIRWRRPPALEATLAGLTDPSGIRAELERIRRALPDDPAGAIGAAKQLVEATAKVVLTERHLPVAGDAKVPELVKAAQQALHLHPSSTILGPDSSEAVKKILGVVSSIAVGVAELRNRGYGSGHGQASTPTGLSPRHAHLAVNAAITWCHLLLDTLADPTAPWRRQRTNVSDPLE
jgi:Abortive infection C-terminus